MGQVRTVQRRARSTLCLALFALMAAAFALALPTQAFAKTVHKDGFDDMPGGTIQMQAPLFIDEASFSTTNPNIKRGLIADLKDTFGGTIWGWSDSCVIYYDGLDTTANTPSGTRSVTGSWSLKWENVGTDADGDAIDALLTMSDIEVRATNTKGLDFVFADSTKGRNTFTVDMIGYANPSTYTDGAQMNLSLKMYKHGTTDIASGKYLMAFADIDVPSGYGSKWHEQVKLLGGFADVVVSYTASDPDHAELSNDSDELAPATGKPKGSTVTPAEGYRFDGWVDVSTGEKVGTSPAFAPSRGSDGLWHAATYEARIAPISYTVAFDANGGEGSMDGQAFAYDEEKPLDGCAFERTGYAFAGWAIEPGGDVAYDDAEVVSALASEDGATVTLYAVWAENPDVTIGYIADDPEHSTPSVSSETVAPATGEAKGSSLAVADGYAFDRWEDWAGTVVSEDPTIVPERGGKGLWRTSEYTAYVAPISYTVAFDANGGTGKMDDQQMTYDAAQALRKNAFERPGYIFLGWNTAPDGSATPFEDAQEVVNLASEEGDKVVLYAQWAKRTLAVTFYDGQGHIIETDTVPYGGKATAPSEPVRDGYAFVGWDTDFGCVTKDIDVTAMWKPVSDAAIAAEAASGSSAGPAPAGTAGATTPLDQTGDPGLALGFAAAALAAGAGSAFALRRKRASDGRGER